MHHQEHTTGQTLTKNTYLYQSTIYKQVTHSYFEQFKNTV